MDETPKTTKRSRKRKRPHHSTDELEDLSPTARNSEATPTIHSRRGRSQSRTPTEESSEGGAATPDDPEPARKKKRKKKRDCDDSLPTPESDRDELKSSVKLDRFFGRRGEDVENWLFHVNAAAKFSRLPDRRKLAAAAMALSADARAEFRAFLGHDDVSDLTWRQFEVFLREQFGPRDPTRHWTNKLMVCKQTARETVAEFASRFKQILLQLQNADPDAVSKTMTIYLVFRPDFVANSRTNSNGNHRHRSRRRSRLRKPPNEFGIILEPVFTTTIATPCDTIAYQLRRRRRRNRALREARVTPPFNCCKRSYNSKRS